MSESPKDTKPTASSKRQLVKILVPVLIVVIVLGIYLFKNPPQEDTASQQAEPSPEVSTQQSEPNTPEVDYLSAEFDLDATNDFDLSELLSYGLPVIIDFGSDSCIPCQKMAPVLEELNEELRGKAIVKFVDVWENPDAAKNFPLSVIPTQFFFGSDGKPYVPDSQDSGFIMYEHQETGVHVFTAHEGGMEKDDLLAVLKGLGVE